MLHSPDPMDRFSEPMKMWHQLRLQRHGGILHNDKYTEEWARVHFYALVK